MMRSLLILPLVSFLSGIVLENIFCIKIPPLMFFLIILSILLYMLFFALNNRRTFLLGICLMLFITGAFRMYSEQVVPSNDISRYISEVPTEAAMIAKVIDYPEKKDGKSSRYEFLVQVNELLIRGKKHFITGTVLVKLYDNNIRCFYGDIIAARGELYCPGGIRNPGGFDYKKYLSARGVTAIFRIDKEEHIIRLGTHNNFYGTIKLKILKFRQEVEQLFDKYLKYPASNISKAVFLGLKSGLDESLKEPFVNTGTMHIMAVSGLHLGLAAGVFMLLLKVMKWENIAAHVLLISFIAGVVIFTGNRTPVSRAGIMFIIAVIGRILSRKTHILNSLVYAAFIICFFHPISLFMNEFMFSFMAVLGIIFWNDNLRSKNNRSRKSASIYLGNVLSLSFIVWTILMPVLAYNFNTITPSVIVANLFAVPLVFCILSACAVFLVLNYLFGAGLLVLLCARIIGSMVEVLFWIVKTISSWPFACIKVSTPSMLGIYAYYSLIFCMFIFAKKFSKRDQIIMILLLSANLFVWNECFALSPGSLMVTFFDVGNGDSSVIETSSGKVILIDGGTGPGEFGNDAGKRIIAVYLRQRRIRKIDMVILSHPHYDHAGGLEYILENFEVCDFVSGSCDKTNYLNEKLLRICKTRGIPHILVEKGDIIQLGKDIDLEVLHPDREEMYTDLNNNSLVLKMIDIRSNKSVLYCGDIEEEGIKSLLMQGVDMKADIIKIPHHGSDNVDIDIFENFIDIVDPKYAVITNGKYLSEKNHILKSLEEKKVSIYSSKTDGAVVFDEANGTFTIKHFAERCSYRDKQIKKLKTAHYN